MAIRKVDLARELNVTAAAVNVWLKRGLPVDARGQFDRETALLWLTQHVQPQVAASGVSRGSMRAAELLRGPSLLSADHVAPVSQVAKPPDQAFVPPTNDAQPPTAPLASDSAAPIAAKSQDRTKSRSSYKSGNGYDDLGSPALQRSRRDRALADRLERINLVEEARLVRIDDVVGVYAQELVVVRNRLLGMASKIAPRAHAAAAEGTRAVYEVIHHEVVEILTELSAPDSEDAA